MDEIGPGGEVPLEMALQAFSLALEPLPGIDPPPGEPGPIVSATGPLLWMLRYWEDLTEPEQAVVERHLRIFPGVDSSVSPSAGGLAPIVAAAVPVFVAQPDDTPACDTTDALRDIATTVAAEIGQLLGRQLSVPLDVCGISGDYGYMAPQTADGENRRGDAARCRVGLPTWVTDAAPESRAHVAYQVAGCFMADSMPIEKLLQLPPWLMLGMSRYLAEVVGDLADESWFEWLATPDKTLFSRADDALGFYVHLEDADADVGLTIDAMLSFWLDAGNDAAYAVAVAANDDVLDEWGPGYFGQTELGDPWFFEGAGLSPRDPEGQVIKDELYNGSGRALEAPPFAAAAYEIDIFADVVTLGPVAGDLGLIWEGTATAVTIDAIGLVSSAEAHLIFMDEYSLGLEVVDGEEVIGEDLSNIFPDGRIRLPDGVEHLVADATGYSFCTVPGGCSCPEGSPRDASTLVDTQQGKARVGLAGGATGVSYQVTGLSLENYCSVERSDERINFVLVAGSWSYDFHGGTANNGCPWPSQSISGTFDVDSSSHLTFDLSHDPPQWWGFAHTNQDGDPVMVEECVVDGTRKYDGGEWTPTAAVTWIPASMSGDPWSPLVGSTVSGSIARGGTPPDVYAWELTRRDAPLGGT